MTTQESSLEYILPNLQKLSLQNLLQHEKDGLQQVVGDILFEIGRRKNLESNLLTGLEKRISHLHSELMNTPSVYQLNTLERRIALEQDVEKIEIEKIHTQEKATHDLIELKKVLWHYWLLLHKKQSQINLI